jgi:hypothetical protein
VSADAADHSTPPCGPENDGQRCRCGKNEGKVVPDQSPTIDLPAPALLAILDRPAWSGIAPLESSRRLIRNVSGVARPPTSLLRQHCALVV